MRRPKLMTSSLAESPICPIPSPVRPRAPEDTDLSTDISPPILIKCQGASLPTLDLPRVSGPLKTDLGDLVMEVAVVRSVQ